MLKLFGVLCVTLCTTLISYFSSSRKREHLENLWKLYETGIAISREVEYRSGSVKEMLSLNKAEEMDLNTQEKETVISFVQTLGILGKDEQKKSCACFAETMKDYAEKAQEKLEEQIRVNNALGLFGGLFLSMLIL